MAKVGPKGKYEYWRTPDGLLLLAAWARDGATLAIIAQKCGVSVKTICEWKNKYSEIGEALKRNNELVDIEVENALLKNALGGFVTVQKPLKTKKVMVKDGVRQEVEEIKYVDEQIYIKPDPVAQFFWLKNRKPKQWRDKQDMVVERADIEDDPLSASLKELAGELDGN